MTQYLRQSTAATLKLGPFIDTDGAAATGLTLSQADIRLSKNGGNMAQKTESTSCTHDELGLYDCPIDATDTNTLGRLDVSAGEAGALIVVQSFSVIPQGVWDTLFATGGPRGLYLAQGTIGATGNSTTALHLTGLTYGDDEINNQLLMIYDVSATEWHARWVDDWADTGDLATVVTLPFTPENSVDTYALLAIRREANVTHWLGTAAATPTVAGVPEVDVTHFGGSAATTSSGRPEVNTTHAAGTAWASGAITAAAIANAAIDAATFAADVDAEILSYLVDDATRIDASALNTAVVTTVPAIVADTNELQTDWADGGRLDLILDARASQSSINTIDDFLDTEITAIMNRLPAALTADGNMKSDILRVVGIAIQAAGGGTSAVGEV